MMSGFMGDQFLTDEMYLIDLFRKLAWTKIGKHLREFGGWYQGVDCSFFRRQFLVELVRCHTPKAIHPWLKIVRSKLFEAESEKPRSPPWYSLAFRQQVGRRKPKESSFGKRFATLHARSLYRLVTDNFYRMRMQW